MFKPYFLYYLFSNYPSATSNIIIIINPNANPIVVILECSPSTDSGNNSSTTTYIIAPAANDNKYGSNGKIIPVSIIVIAAAIGSTIPDNIP